MTSNSSGRVSTCCSVMSAMASLIRILPAARAAFCSALAAFSPLAGLGAFPLVPGVDLLGEFAFGQGVAPVAEGALGELHDVALVHQRQALALVGDGVLEGGSDQALGAFAARPA